MSAKLLVAHLQQLVTTLYFYSSLKISHFFANLHNPHLKESEGNCLAIKALKQSSSVKGSATEAEEEAATRILHDLDKPSVHSPTVMLGTKWMLGFEFC